MLVAAIVLVIPPATSLGLVTAVPEVEAVEVAVAGVVSAAVGVWWVVLLVAIATVSIVT